MKKHYIVLLIALLSVGFVKKTQAKSLVDVHYKVDEEYDRYKKRGNDFFAQGNYDRAKGQFENCLEVPGFAQDKYATERIQLCNKIIELRQKASDLLSQQKASDAVTTYQEILALNPADPIIKSTLTDYWSNEGNKLYAAKEYAGAIKHYEEALKHAEKKDLLLIQVENSKQFLAQQKPSQNVTEPVIETPRPSRRIALKVGTALVGLGAGFYAYQLQSQYQTSLDNLKKVNAEVDPDNTGIINSDADYDRWSKAYSEAEKARGKRSVYKACLGVAAAAVLAEVYLLVHKPKKEKGFALKPASSGIGLSLRYTH